MMTKLTIFPAIKISSAAIASLVLAPLVAVSEEQPVQCTIRISKPPNGLRLEAMAKTRKEISGSYKLSVVKQNDAGSSRNLQSGEFALDDGGDHVLTTLQMERAAEGHYRAELSLEWKDGQVSCEAP